MRMSVSSQKSTAQVDLMLEQSLQKAFKRHINVLLPGYSDVSVSEKRINNLILCN